jgi:acyl-CoA reductase-like NAD-dependent aldehyde dehydrogenase
LSITILASALYAGSRVLLRPSLQCASSGVLLAELIRKSQPPTSVVVVNSLAQDFLEACCQSEHIDLIHYIGSNRYAMSVLNDALAATKHCLLDGQGNGVLYVDASFPLDDAVRLITTGATRFNGLTCTSVNGVLVEAGMHAQLRDALVASFGALEVGEPHDARTQIGPLFSAEHAAGLARDLRAGPSSRLRCGGMASGAYFRPAVVEGVSPTDPLVREGVFGPALWIQPVREDEVFAWLRSNLFPLSDTVLSTRSDVIETFTLNSKAARICVNEDPSVESMFEPWGGYLNPVSNWIDKYRQSYQIDGRPSVLAERFRVFGAGGV